nr:hypothetical protein [Tanacetum cinerariifolium]
MSVVNEKVPNLDANLLEMACHLEERFYPHFLATISSRRWLLTHSMKLFLVKCLNSLDYLMALGATICCAIKKGMQSVPATDIDHGKEGMSLTYVTAYNPYIEADFNSAPQELYGVDFPLLVELKSHKDASVEDIMNLLRLKVVSPYWCLDHPRSEPLSVQSLMGEASNFGGVPAAAMATTALSTTFTFASSVPLISTDDYEIVGVDGQEVLNVGMPISTWITAYVLYISENGISPLLDLIIVRCAKLVDAILLSTFAFLFAPLGTCLIENSLKVLRPAIKASYSASLLVASNLNLRAYVNSTPSGFVIIRPAPKPSMHDDPFVNSIHGSESSSLSSMGVSGRSSSGRSTMKSAKICPLTNVLGL